LLTLSDLYLFQKTVRKPQLIIVYKTAITALIPK
jgi:hypothetical protein